MAEAEDYSNASIVTQAKERYEIAKAAVSDFRTKAVEDERFYMGDSDNGWQWPQNITLQRATLEKRPCLTINVTAQHVNQVVNTLKENPPEGKILPVDDNADIKTAEIIEGLIRNIQNTSNADDIHSIGVEHAVAGGEGYWKIVTEYEDDGSFDQVVRIMPIFDPAMVHLDPFYKKVDKSDRMWGFVEEDISKEEADKLWPDLNVHSWTFGDAMRGWVKEHTVRVADYYVCDEEPDTLYQLPDGGTAYESDIPAEALKIVKQMVKEGKLKSRSCTKKVWKIHKLVGGAEGVVETTIWPGKYLPIVEVSGILLGW